jgi:ketosteroid isomerase-like protein
MDRAPLLQAPLTVSRGRSTIRSMALGACVLALAGALFGGDGRAAAEPSRAPGAATQEDALWSRLRRIENAFRAGDAAALRGSFPATAKLRVDLPGVPGCPASYGPGQLQVVFTQLFEAAPTRGFSFAAEDVTRPSAGTAFARGRWRRGPSDGEAERAHTLTFTLREEDGGWRIHEIFATP